MNTRLKNIIRNIFPPIFIRCFNYIKFDKYGWFGDYKSWEEAKKASKGYGTDIILEKVKTSALKVKNGEAVYERDSVIFDKIEYSYPILAALMWIVCNEEGRLSLIDFGGALGSSYFQNRIFLDGLKDVRWNIIEQKHFVECGKALFENKILKFYESIEDCLRAQAPYTVLLSGVLQYMEKPYDLIELLISRGFKYIIFDRTSFNKSAGDRLAVQKVDPDIFDASYPCWFLDIDRLKEKFMDRYILIDEFISFENIEYRGAPVLKGLVYKKIK